MNKWLELVAHYQYLENLPITNDGYRLRISVSSNSHEQVQQAIIRQRLFHSYHDARFLWRRTPLWEWSRWLPHMKLQQFNSAVVLYTINVVAITPVNVAYQMIKEHKQAAEQEEVISNQLYSSLCIVITDLFPNARP